MVTALVNVMSIDNRRSHDLQVLIRVLISALIWVDEILIASILDIIVCMLSQLHKPLIRSILLPPEVRVVPLVLLQCCL